MASQDMNISADCSARPSWWQAAAVCGKLLVGVGVGVGVEVGG